jgi:prepilin-type N-terminal cleavage/methylation domain-containing protein
MKFFFKNNNSGGFTLVEVLIACAILSLCILALMTASSKGIQTSSQALRQTQAGFILEEGAEAVKTIRDASWSNISSLTTGTTYYLSFSTSTNTWSLSTTPPPTIDSIFTRTVVLSAVNRDSNDDIASSGTLDARTKKVTVTVSWPISDNTTSSKTLDFYISDIFS